MAVRVETAASAAAAVAAGLAGPPPWPEALSLTGAAAQQEARLSRMTSPQVARATTGQVANWGLVSSPAVVAATRAVD